MNKVEIQNAVAKEVNDYLCEGIVATAFNAGDPTYGVIRANFPYNAASDLEGGRVELGGSSYHISVFSPSDRKVYLIPPFATTPPAAGVTFSVFKYSKSGDYDNIFNQVFGRLSSKVLIDMEASMAVGTGVAYSLPTNWKYVNTVELYKEDEVVPVELVHRKWAVRMGKLFLKATLSSDTYPTLIALGQAHPTLPLTATAKLEQDGIFQDCLVFRMAEHFAMRQFVKTSVKSFGSSYRSDSSEGVTSRGATRSLSASMVSTIIGTSVATTSRSATVNLAATTIGTTNTAATTTTGATRSLSSTIIAKNFLDATTKTIATIIATSVFGATKSLDSTLSVFATLFSTTNLSVSATTTMGGTVSLSASRGATTTVIEHSTGRQEVTSETSSQKEVTQQQEVEQRTESENTGEREERQEVSTEKEVSNETESKAESEQRQEVSLQTETRAERETNLEVATEKEDKTERETSIELTSEAGSEARQELQSEQEQNKELETETGKDTSYQYQSGFDRNITWEEQEDWLALASTARINGDTLEQYLFERVRPNSRRLR